MTLLRHMQAPTLGLASRPVRSFSAGQAARRPLNLGSPVLARLPGHSKSRNAKLSTPARSVHPSKLNRCGLLKIVTSGALFQTPNPCYYFTITQSHHIYFLMQGPWFSRVSLCTRYLRSSWPSFYLHCCVPQGHQTHRCGFPRRFLCSQP